MVERGISADHATVHRWVVRHSPELPERFNRRKRTVGRKWHVDQTYIKVRGQWMYLYRAIDSNGDTIEFRFSERRDLKPIRIGQSADLKIVSSRIMGRSSGGSGRCSGSSRSIVHA